jgi:glycine cleavage system H protein|tara:strand:- start:110 stop:511 length:402 start_codon:yes stop_codon:yes gene_type:complete
VQGGEDMSEVPDELRYTKEHEWIRIEGDSVTIGVTDYAQDALTDVVWVELPEIGAVVESMESFASVESVKSVSEIYAPVGGEVIEVNDSLEDSPEQINEDPYGNGWICKMSIADASELENLLDGATYRGLIEE